VHDGRHEFCCLHDAKISMSYRRRSRSTTIPPHAAATTTAAAAAAAAATADSVTVSPVADGSLFACRAISRSTGYGYPNLRGLVHRPQESFFPGSKRFSNCRLAPPEIDVRSKLVCYTINASPCPTERENLWTPLGLHPITKRSARKTAFEAAIAR
jgi:hypothetical protein